MEAEMEATDPVLVTIGDIAVSKDWIVTPEGTAPVAGSTWEIVDLTRTETKRPAWTIVFAILLFPIGLLFLLITEPVLVGVIEVRVRGDKLFYATQVAPLTQYGITTIRQNVNHVQSIAAAR